MLRIDQWLEDVRAYRRVSLDTNVVIYALEDVSPYSRLALHVLRFMARGYIAGIVSTVVEAEVLVRPLRDRDLLTLTKVRRFFGSSPGLSVRTFDRAVAMRAARVRADSQLRLPDAIIVATALEERCDALIGNDAQMAQQTVGMPYLYLEDYVS